MCSFCHLAKFFASGMQIEMLRPSGSIKNRSRKWKVPISSSVSMRSNQTVRFFICFQNDSPKKKDFLFLVINFKYEKNSGSLILLDVFFS